MAKGFVFSRPGGCFQPSLLDSQRQGPPVKLTCSVHHMRIHPTAQICFTENLILVLAFHYLTCPKRCLKFPRFWNRFWEEKLGRNYIFLKFFIYSHVLSMRRAFHLLPGQFELRQYHRHNKKLLFNLAILSIIIYYQLSIILF